MKESGCKLEGKQYMAIKVKSLIKVTILVDFLFMVYFPNSIFAEVIVLKYGQTINAKIKEKSPEYIRVEVDNSGIVLKYPIEQIESIDGERLVSEKGFGGQESGWYINTEFNFKIKKIPGWVSSERKDEIRGVPVLLVNFTGPSVKKNIRGPLMITLKKFPEILSGRIVYLMKREQFITYTDRIINSVRKKIKGAASVKNNLSPDTFSIDNLKEREVRFELNDENGNSKTGILMFFEPVQIGSKYLEIQVFFLDNSKDYFEYRPELEKILKSITVLR